MSTNRVFNNSTFTMLIFLILFASVSGEGFVPNLSTAASDYFSGNEIWNATGNDHTGRPCNGPFRICLVSNSYCDSDGFCRCKAEYPVLVEPYSCKKGRHYGDQCAYKEECLYYDPNSYCKLLPNGSVCECRAGFIYSELKQICEKTCDKDCGWNEECFFDGENMSCRCRIGYSFLLGACEECNCGENATCIFEPAEENDGTYRKVCHCNTGYLHVDGVCREIKACDPNPCKNGGTCLPKGTNYICNCDNMHRGNNCETEIKPCVPSPCKNGGTCQPKGANYTCECDNMHKGNNCEIEIKPCVPNPCKNGGTCQSKGGNYTCECDNMHNGNNCEIVINPCDPNPCKYGGTCIPKGSNYTCSCDNLYKGKNCEIGDDSCNPNPCLNGGICIPKQNPYRCRCDDQHTGFNCEKNAELPFVFQLEENAMQEREGTEQRFGGIISQFREVNYTNRNVVMRFLSPKRKEKMIEEL